MASDSTPQKSMFDSDSADSGSSVRGSAHLKGTRSLERLRDRIELAARELKRLREENRELHKQIDSLRTQGSEAVEGSTIHFTESPGELREKVESFIAAIDAQIERSRNRADEENPS